MPSPVIVPISMFPEVIIRQSLLFPLGEFVDMPPGRETLEVSAPTHRGSCAYV